jgi:hypothetical protein
MHDEYRKLPIVIPGLTKPPVARRPTLEFEPHIRNERVNGLLPKNRERMW